MTLWQRSLYIMSGEQSRPSVRSLFEKLRNAEYERQAVADYLLYQLFAAEARRRPLLWPALRAASRHHLEQSAIKTQILPGPSGDIARRQIEEGNFWDGLNNLDTEISRLQRWIQVSSSPRENDLVRLCEYLQLYGITLGQLGRAAEGVKWLDESLLIYKNLEPGARSSRIDLEESSVLLKVWYLQLENKHSEALRLIHETLNDSSSSSYSKRTREFLKAARGLLVDYVPLMGNDTTDIATDELLRTLIEKVQRCETVDALRKVRKEILKATTEGSRIRLDTDKLLERAINDITRQSALTRQQLRISQTDEPLVEMSEEEICRKFAKPEHRQLIRDSQAAMRQSRAQVNQIREGMDKFTQLTDAFTERVNSETIATARRITKRMNSVPIRERAKWLWLLTLRIGLQIVVGAYVIGESLAKTIRYRGFEWLRGIDFRHKEVVFRTAVLLLMFAIGKAFEAYTDKKEVARYKRALISLVIERARTLWTGYNALVRLSQAATQSLEEVRKLALRDARH